MKTKIVKHIDIWEFLVTSSGSTASLSGPLAFEMIYRGILDFGQRAQVSQGKEIEVSAGQRERLLQIEEIGSHLNPLRGAEARE